MPPPPHPAIGKNCWLSLQDLWEFQDCAGGVKGGASLFASLVYVSLQVFLLVVTEV